MESGTKRQSELLWARLVMRKWLNISGKDSDYSADIEDPDSEGDEGEAYVPLASTSTTPNNSNFEYDEWERNLRTGRGDFIDSPPKIRRRTSETFRAQYINTKELRIRVGTWNVGGQVPPDDLDIDDWININEPADIYLLGIQEIVPLNAGNIFGAEDIRPAAKWENIIRETLNRVRPSTTKVKCFSDPPSPSKFKPSEDVPDLEEQIFVESDGDIGEEIYPLDEDSNSYDEGKASPVNSENNFKSSKLDCIESEKLDMPVEQDLQRQFSSRKKLDKLNCLQTEDSTDNVEVPAAQKFGRLTKMLSNSERIALSWPEPPRELLSLHVLERTSTFKPVESFNGSKSFKKYNSFKSFTNEVSPGIALLAEINLESLMNQKRRSPYVRIVSKQMVGIFLTVWVRRSLRRHIQNLRVSTVGVGAMGYIGNKGSVSVSMSIYQTLFCFVCTHLTSGEKDGDELKRNANVHEIHRRTQFRPLSSLGLPKSIHGHDRIIWLGDLNYRINLSYSKARELISEKEWSQLMESDQLVRELRKGRAFDGWSEGTLTFPPTYKYELNSEKYCKEDPKAGRRTPAWCDRIISYGKGMRLLSYMKTELKFSDHRPVSATYMAEVEVLSPRKLQQALTFTDAEIETELVADLGY